ncbi:MAG: hypothetical protein CBB94_04800 [Gammaproteobacteria bacterium TMED34]|nr:MAG: hypothetical protein CBB94_04800 [Gammaproteobacteria bacterium TMED34]|tara:strand:+ start:373 stop:630 length:258 start_codon:yes stop_codon:yes gene_type:complete
MGFVVSIENVLITIGIALRQLGLNENFPKLALIKITDRVHGPDDNHASQFIDLFGQASTRHQTGAQKIRIISGCMAIYLACEFAE